MPVWTAPDVELLVFTRKEGLLSRVAHNLRIRATRVRLEVDRADPDHPRIEAVVPVDGLQVETAVDDAGRPLPDALSAKDRREIERNIAADVLDAPKHPEVRFEADGATPDRIEGTLHLHGQARRVVLPLRLDGDRLVGELTLDQRDFGIKPYRAALGALKVAPEVRVSVRLPADALTG